MALDRPNGGEIRNDRLERVLQHSAPYEDDATAPKQPAELRTREEYYEAALTADEGSGAVDDNGVADRRSDPSAWDATDVETRPSVDSIRVTPERAMHILDGDETGSGGGHRHGVGRPGKTEFPANWDDAKIISTALNVARGPDRPPVRQDWNDTWLCTGTRDGVDVSVVVQRSGEILTSWPEEGGPGVVRNPKKGHHD